MRAASFHWVQTLRLFRLGGKLTRRPPLRCSGNVPAGKQADVGPILAHVTDPTLENVLAAKSGEPALLETGSRARGPHSLAMLRGRDTLRRRQV